MYCVYHMYVLVIFVFVSLENFQCLLVKVNEHYSEAFGFAAQYWTYPVCSIEVKVFP